MNIVQQNLLKFTSLPVGHKIGPNRLGMENYRQNNEPKNGVYLAFHQILNEKEGS